MSEARHHRAVRTEYIFIPVAGPDYGQQRKPPAYPRQGREAWKPAQAIPRRATKAQATVNLMRRIAEQEIAVRAWMDALRRGDHHANR